MQVRSRAFIKIMNKVVTMLNYSCIRFHSEVNDETITVLTNLIKQGTKVYFFTYDPIHLLLENEFLQSAIKKQFLFAYEVYFNRELTNDFDFYDGNVPLDTLKLLSKYTPLFNMEQFLVEHAPVEENISVSAGAGTGKTTVMINRVIFLKYIHPNISLAELVLITFTNKAALHLREKIVEKLKDYFHFTNNFVFLQWLQELRHMKIGTIHSFAHTILSENQDLLFERTNLPISQFNYRRKKIIEEVIDEFHEEYPEKFNRFKYIEQYRMIQAVEAIIAQINNYSISLAVLETLDFGDSEDGSHELFEYVVRKTLTRLEEYKKKHEYMDVYDLITNLEKMIVDNPHYRMPYKYIFIDEFQDTDRRQTMFFSYIANHYPLNLFVVGDVKQSIYRFRGADYTAFDQLKSQVTIHNEFYLQTNYRSDKNLLMTFNELFSTWHSKVRTFKYSEQDYLLPGKEMEFSNEAAIKNVHFTTKIKFIEFIKSLEGTDTAILVRSNREVNELAMFCEQKKIFFTAEQDGDFYRSLPVREFYQLIIRFTHPMLWKNRYLLHLSSYGERTIKVGDVLEQFSSERLGLSGIQEVDLRLSEYENQFNDKGVFEVLHEIIEEINPAKVYAERFLRDRYALYQEDEKNLFEQAEIKFKEYELNLIQLIYLLKKELKNTMPTLFNIEKLLRLKIQTDQTISRKTFDSTGKHRLSIMTVHKSKGLEFDHIFIPNTKRPFHHFTKSDVIIEDTLVGYRTFIQKGKVFKNNHYEQLTRLNKEENVGEEARLLYVALTRAKKKVYIDAPQSSNNHEVRQWGDLIATNITNGTNRKIVF